MPTMRFVCLTTHASIYSLFLIATCAALCPKNGVQGLTKGSCYFGLNVNETFSDADAFCSTYFYGNLASITTSRDDTKVQDLARALFKEAQNVWLGGTYDGKKVEWLDGSPDVYQNFVKGAQPGKIVLNLVSGNWSTATWNAILPFICLQREDLRSTTLAPPSTAPVTQAVITTSVPSTVTPPTCLKDAPCPSEWTYSANLKMCYRAIFRVNFDQAVDRCKSMTSSLSSIHSDEENRLVNELVKTGYSITDGAYGGLVGGKRTGPGASEWMWIDGTPWNYTKWAAEEPTFSRGAEFCLVVYNDKTTYSKDPNGDIQKWNDFRCDVTFRAAVCRQEAMY